MIKRNHPVTFPGKCLFIILTLMVLLISSCTAQYPLNPSINVIERDNFMRDRLSRSDRSDELVLILAFSGGGTRAAALSYGVLEALARVEIPVIDNRTSQNVPGRKHALLDEVDMISSVSGGSFTAAYYGLYGRDTFKDYRERFLIQNHQGEMLWILFNPVNWPRLWSPRFGRSDLAEEYYDSNIFKGATLKDMMRVNGPIINILATDVVDGLTFSFSPSTFSMICSDFYRFPVSRAVAASAAFPGAFSPILLKNYAGKCNAEIPAWIKAALDKPDLTSRSYHIAKRMRTYFDREAKPYIYLLDGGVSDNLGLRGMMDSIATRGGIRDSLAAAGLDKARQVAFIIVDAETQENPHWRLIDEIPGLGTILGASSTIMINKYNFETIDLLRRYIQDWSQEHPEKGNLPIDFYVVQVAFDALPDQKDRDYFHDIPTSLYLPEEQVDRLREAAARILYASEPFRKLVKDLGGVIPEVPPRKPTP